MDELGNRFIEYLNSMNNANSSNKNALAESQVLSKYYNEIKIDRDLGKTIYKKLFEDVRTGIILTGHAGDGKTSILIQILSELGYFDNGKKPLKESELYDNKLFYVKDMSELNEEKQKEMLKKFLTYPKKGCSSLLISNTGPLINTFNNILTGKDSETLEINLLNELDNNTLNPIEVDIDGEKCDFIAVNMANVDNTYLVKQILPNLLKKNLWEKCEGCRVKDICPIAFNYNICTNNLDRITTILEQMYVWFKENESRLTIRQMLSHLSFSITGNLSCGEIYEKFKSRNEHLESDTLFDYAFPNLLFGYKGTNLLSESLNIKAIKELNKVSIDENTLTADYQLFVHENFDVFDKDIKFMLEEKLKLSEYDLGVMNNQATRFRRSLRRFYILCSKLNDHEFEKLKNEVFSESFNTYYKISRQKHVSHKEKNKIKDILFEGLYKTFIGVYPKNQEILYLTVKKELDDIQNVQLVLGEVSKNDITIVNKKKTSLLENNRDIYEIKIKFNRIKNPIDLTFQMYQYFMRISEGEIFTSLNPSFTFGLNKLKATLLKEYKYYKEDEIEDNPEIKLLVIKKDNPENINFIIEKGILEIL